MKKIFKELKEVLFYGSREGKVLKKYPCIECEKWDFNSLEDSTVLVLTKKINFLGKERDIAKEFIVNTDIANKYNIGDYVIL